jgi:hypothetical protein
MFHWKPVWTSTRFKFYIMQQEININLVHGLAWTLPAVESIWMMMPMGRSRKLKSVSTKSFPASRNSTRPVFLHRSTDTLNVTVEVSAIWGWSKCCSENFPWKPANQSTDYPTNSSSTYLTTIVTIDPGLQLQLQSSKYSTRNVTDSGQSFTQTTARWLTGQWTQLRSRSTRCRVITYDSKLEKSGQQITWRRGY